MYTFINRWPIPQGLWSWNVNDPGASNRKPDGIRLVPSVNTGTYNRNGFSIHSCLNAFGPSLGPRFCSEGCITGLSNDMQKLNELIFSEPDSTLTVNMARLLTIVFFSLFLRVQLLQDNFRES